MGYLRETEYFFFEETITDRNGSNAMSCYTIKSVCLYQHIDWLRLTHMTSNIISYPILGIISLSTRQDLYVQRYARLMFIVLFINSLIFCFQIISVFLTKQKGTNNLILISTDYPG